MDSLFLGFTIGATISGTFQTAFGTAKKSINQLDLQTKQLTARQERLGQVMSRSLARPHANLSKLYQQHRKIGNAIERNINAQRQLNSAMSFSNRVDGLGQSSRDGMLNEAAKLAVVGGLVKSTVTQSAMFKDQINDLAVTGEWSLAEQQKIGKAVRASALQYNQTTTDINIGLGTLVAGGISTVGELDAFTPKMSRIATAWRTSFEDVGNTALALKNNLNIGAEGFDRAMNMLGYAGKAGQFEAKDMAKWLPSLTPFYQSLGVQGEQAVAEIGASLQIARKGAGSSDEAANNMRNFLAKLTAPDTLKDFDKAGIDLQKNMKSLVAEGMTPMQAMMSSITEYIGTKSPQAMQDFNKAMQLKDAKERQMAIDRLNETYKLGELFQDQQALSFIRPMLNNKQEFEQIKAGSVKSADNDVIGKDFAKRMQSPMEKFKSFKLVVNDMAITLGNVFMPALLDTANALKPMVTNFANWAKQHPKLISGTVGLVAGLIGLKLVFFTIGWVVMGIISPFAKLMVVFARLKSAVAFIRGLSALGRFTPLIARFGGALRKVGTVVRWLSMLFRFSPWGIAITALAVGAMLIYKNWDKLKPFFTRLWNGLKSLFNASSG